MSSREAKVEGRRRRGAGRPGASAGRLPDTTARRAPENLAVLLRELLMAVNDHIHARLCEEGHPEIRIAHGVVFQFIDDAGTHVSTLAQRAQMTKQSMAELVAHLERHGYVERIPDPADRRAKLVRVTSRGRQAVPVARDAIAEVEERWSEVLGERDMNRLRGLLERLNEKLGG
jgi:DNA-binding MarR family transcriptional regulator